MLNSRSEYVRCFISSLCLVEEDVLTELEKIEEESIRKTSEEREMKSMVMGKEEVGSRARNLKLSVSVPEKCGKDRGKYDLLVGWV